ncbi:MAG: aminoacetone oxidase family FAD-binding enzyme, partial [Clostridia bacterium]|nr:aminoacetone oxidase family FAD-binding enzyme [Clostridia bacterium]
TYFAEKVVLCAGGKAAKNFGSDGSAYALAEKFGHTVTALYPSLVQLKTDVTHTKTLKGIRVSDGGLTATLANGERVGLRGDVIFTDYGVSGDAVFRISAFIADKISSGVRLTVDFLPDVSEGDILAALQRKQAAFPDLSNGELLFGIVNNQVGRAVMKRANGDLKRAAKLVKEFDLTVTGSLGFDYAQVTKGGISLSEVTENLESRFVNGLYFAGEILDVDGPCGGFNLQWAYSSAMRVAAALNGEKA